MLDISYVVGFVTQFMQNDQTDHCNAIIDILRYLKRALGQGPLYKKGNTQIIGYCDELSHWQEIYIILCVPLKECSLVEEQETKCRFLVHWTSWI